MPINPDFVPNPPYRPDLTGPFAAFRAKHPYDDRTDDELYALWDEDGED